MVFQNAGSELSTFQSQVPTHCVTRGTSHRPYLMAVDGGLGQVKHVQPFAQRGHLVNVQRGTVRKGGFAFVKAGCGVEGKQDSQQ